MRVEFNKDMFGVYNMEDLINQDIICRRPRFLAESVVYTEVATCLLHFLAMLIFVVLKSGFA